MRKLNEQKLYGMKARWERDQAREGRTSTRFVPGKEEPEDRRVTVLLLAKDLDAVMVRETNKDPQGCLQSVQGNCPCPLKVIGVGPVGIRGRLSDRAQLHGSWYRYSGVQDQLREFTETYFL